MSIPPFIATLGMMYVAKGLSLVISGLKPIYFNDTPIFNQIAMGSVDLGGVIPGFPMPNAVLIMFGAAIVAALILNARCWAATLCDRQQRRGDAALRRQRRRVEDGDLRAVRPLCRAGRRPDGLAPEFGTAGPGRGLRVGCHRRGRDRRHQS